MNHLLLDGAVLAIAICAMLWLDHRFDSISREREAAADREAARVERERIIKIISESDGWYLIRPARGNAVPAKILDREEITMLLLPS